MRDGIRMIGRLSSKKQAFAALTLVTIAFGVAGQAHAAIPSASVEASPDTLSAEAPDANYLLTLQSGESQTDFTLAIQPPSWGMTGVFGSPFSFRGASISGDALIVGYSSDVADPPADACFRGAPVSTLKYAIEMPPNSTASMTVPFSLAETPWTMESFQTSIGIADTNDHKALDVPAVDVNGSLSPLVRTWKGGANPGKSVFKVNARRKVSVAGRVYGGGKGKRVRLRAKKAGSRKSTSLGFVRSNSNGYFKKKVRIGVRGKFEIFGVLDGGSSCGSTFVAR